MGVKDMLNKFVGTIGGADDDYETDEFEDEEPMEEEQSQRRQPVAAATRRMMHKALPIIYEIENRLSLILNRRLPMWPNVLLTLLAGLHMR